MQTLYKQEKNKQKKNLRNLFQIKQVETVWFQMQINCEKGIFTGQYEARGFFR